MLFFFFVSINDVSYYFSKFNLRQVLKALKFFKVSNFGTISFRQGCPMNINFEIGNLSNLSFYIAPMVDDEDTETEDEL